MADHLSLTQKWLRQNIQPYSHRDIVYSHVDTVLAAYPTLRPKTDVYTYDDGRSQLLLCVHGLLPIAYRRASYNIPIAVWLTHQYPSQPPLVYVVPTSDMLVKAGKFIDVSGRCQPAYIHAWQKKSEGCNLKTLMEVLTDQFSHEPPVYAKPQGPSPSPRPRESPPAVPVTPDYSSRPPPTAPRLNGSISSPSPARRPTPPRPAPVPDLSTRSPTHLPPPAVPRYSHVPGQNASVYPPPRSATPSAVTQEPPLYSTPPTQVPPSSHSQMRSSSATYYSPPPLQGASSQPYPSPELVPPQRWSLQPGNMPMHSTGPPPPPGGFHQPLQVQVPASGLPPAPPIHPGLLPVPPTPSRNYLDEDVEDDTLPALPPHSNAPPRPPNPEILRLHSQVHAKFTSEFAALDQALSTDMQRLQTAQSDLLAGEPAIRDEMARLEAVRDVCRVVAGRFRSTVQSAEMNLHELRRKGDPEVDELICSTTIVYNQLINLVAEDNAIEDTIYHLHRALNSGRIDLDKFLRTTRTLAEEQFMKRALAAKIVASIPMGAWS